jgi:glycosyltransferase involved in cell wall biosynthesis
MALAVSLLFWILYIARTIRNYNMLPKLEREQIKSSKSLPKVSVIIPTRNESKRVTPCIESMKAQTYPNLEVLIVDDSTDNTVEVIKNIVKDDKRFRIIKEEKLAGGWIGKPHAMQQGAKEAKGEWLLLIDADTAHDPDIITSAVKHAIKKKLDMLSILAELVCKSFWEKIIQPIPTGLLIFISPLGKVNDPDSKNAFALGPFILIKHSVFDKIGGYEKIRGKIADDVEMAKLLKESGFKIGLARAHDLMKLRMYETFKDIWEGWSKNIFLGLVQKREIDAKGKQLLILLIGLFVVFDMVVFPFLAIFLSLVVIFILNVSYWWLLLGTSLIVWLFSIFAQSIVHKKYHIGNPIFSPLYFIGGVVTMGIFLNSAVKTLSGRGVKWKGRTYSEKK